MCSLKNLVCLFVLCNFRDFNVMQVPLLLLCSFIFARTLIMGNLKVCPQWFRHHLQIFFSCPNSFSCSGLKLLTSNSSYSLQHWWGVKFKIICKWAYQFLAVSPIQVVSLGHWTVCLHIGTVTSGLFLDVSPSKAWHILIRSFY